MSNRAHDADGLKGVKAMRSGPLPPRSPRLAGNRREAVGPARADGATAPRHPSRPGRRAALPGPTRPAGGRTGPTRAAGGRGRRAVLVVCGVMSAVVLAVSGVAWGVTRYVNDAVGRVNAATAGTPSSGPINILLAGVDLRSGLTARQQRQLHVGHVISANSDTMMLVHVSADRRHVTVVSLPRDSWVDIPGHGMNKINAAFGLGGPALMVRTVEHDTGLTVNNFIEVNFLGFIKVIDALGGVNICLPFAINDHYSGLHLSAGMHHVGGITALKYARDRHSFALSDLTRIKNQQSLLSSLLREAISSGTLANPVKLSRFLQATLAAVKVDRGLDVTALADQLRGISLSGVRFMTVPLSNINYRTPTGEDAVLWDAAAAKSIFQALKSDKKPAKRPKSATSGKPGKKTSGKPGKKSPSHHVNATPQATANPAPGATTAGTRTAAQAACR